MHWVGAGVPEMVGVDRGDIPGFGAVIKGRLQLRLGFGQDFGIWFGTYTNRK